jgi:hypothetical protein
MYPITHKSFRLYRDIVYLKTIYEAHVSMTRCPSCKEIIHLPYLELSEEYVTLEPILARDCMEEGLEFDSR